MSLDRHHPERKDAKKLTNVEKRKNCIFNELQEKEQELANVDAITRLIGLSRHLNGLQAPINGLQAPILRLPMQGLAFTYDEKKLIRALSGLSRFLEENKVSGIEECVDSLNTFILTIWNPDLKSDDVKKSHDKLHRTWEGFDRSVAGKSAQLSFEKAKTLKRWMQAVFGAAGFVLGALLASPAPYLIAGTSIIGYGAGAALGTSLANFLFFNKAKARYSNALLANLRVKDTVDSFEEPNPKNNLPRT